MFANHDFMMTAIVMTTAEPNIATGKGDTSSQTVASSHPRKGPIRALGVPEFFLFRLAPANGPNLVKNAFERLGDFVV